MLKIDCGTVNKNMGKGGCGFTPGLSTMGYLAPESNAIVKEENMVDDATLQAFINAQLHHNDPLKRWHVAGPYRGVDDQSEDPTSFTDEYGDMDITDDVRYRYSFRHRNGECYHRNLRTFNKQHDKYVYFDVDSSNTLLGTIHPDLDEDGNQQMTGYTLNLLFAPGPKKADRSNPMDYRLMLGFADTTEHADRRFAVKTGFNHRLLRGVTEVVLKDVTPSGAAAGVYHVQPMAGCGQTNLAKSLGAALADAGAWVANARDDGNEITISSVALNTSGDAYIITLDTSDTDYDVADTIEINLETVSALETLGAKWYANTDPLAVVAA